VDVETVTTTDRSLLHPVRTTLERADDAFLCVAFVHEKGLQKCGLEPGDLVRAGGDRDRVDARPACRRDE
jgi:hypothetical protein